MRTLRLIPLFVTLAASPILLAQTPYFAREVNRATFDSPGASSWYGRPEKPGIPRSPELTPDIHFPLKLHVDTSQILFDKSTGMYGERGFLLGTAHFANGAEFVYTGNCHNASLQTGHTAVFQARWENPDSSFEILARNPDDNKLQRCSLKIDPKRTVPETAKATAPRILPDANLTTWFPPDAAYPFKLHLVSAGPYGKKPSIFEGKADAEGLSMSYYAHCGGGLPIDERDYQARWLDPGKKLEFLTSDIDGNRRPCTLDVTFSTRTSS